MFQTGLFTRLAALAAMLTLAAGALAEEAVNPSDNATLKLELNDAQPSEKGCRLTFVVNNLLGAELSKAAFEIALFSKEGVVDRLTVLDFKELPAGKTKVARFDLAKVDCGGIGRVLVNHATECAGEGVEPAACLRQLKTETKTGIAFGT